MKIRYIFLLAIVFSGITAFAQFNNHPNAWFPGIVILDSDKIVKGDLSYDAANDLIMCREEGRIKTFAPHETVSFQYYDEGDNVMHKFEVFSIQQNSYYTRKAFFEIVVDGDVNYIRKRNRYPIYQPREGYLEKRHMNPHELAFDYYVEVDGALIKARKFKKEVLPQLLHNEQSLENFMKENHLRTYDIRDQIVLLNYYNRKTQGTKITANTIAENKGNKKSSD